MNRETKKRLGALDVFIIIAVIVCAACLVLRIYGGSEAVNSLESPDMKTYTLVLSVKNIRETSVKYFDMGEKFFLEKEKSRLPLGEMLSIQASGAQSYYTDSDGRILLVTNVGGTEQSSRSDVTLTFEVEGIRNAKGEFLLLGSDYLAVNKLMKIASKYVEVTGTILSITEVESVG